MILKSMCSYYEEAELYFLNLCKNVPRVKLNKENLLISFKQTS